MKFTEWMLRRVYGLGSHVFLGSSRNADWIYEKVQRTRHLPLLAGNIANYYLRRPRVSGFLTLMLEPVFGCNLHCAYCWNSFEGRFRSMRPHLMPWDLFVKVVEGLPESIEAVTVVGVGEPLAHPQICDMIDFIAAKGLRSVLYTNGTLLEGRCLDRLAQTSLDVLCVSVEPDEETSRTYRNVDLSVIRRNVEAFVAAKQPHTQVKLAVVAHAGNVHLLDRVEEYWTGLVDAVKVGRMMIIDANSHPAVCMEPWRGNFFVHTNGEVSPCCVDFFGDLVVGNVHKETLASIVRGTSIPDLLKRMLRGDTPGRCRTCSEYNAPGIPVKAPKRPIRTKDRR